MPLETLSTPADEVLARAERCRAALGGEFRDQIVESLYGHAQRIADDVVTLPEHPRWQWSDHLDRVLTHPLWGLPAMFAMLTLVFYLTVRGANVPSAFIAGILMEEGGLSGFFAQHFNLALPAMMSVSVYELFHSLATLLHSPAWLSGFLIDGVYLSLAWVIAVMLPPMAIFFPMFTLLEDLGYLPRVAFNLDWILRACGAHGKQALTMSMGYGCNAAGVIACRVIDSPREKLIAILTNNFVPCNGRFPTLILLGMIMVTAANVPAVLASTIAVGSVIAVVMLGILFTFAASWMLSRTVLRGEASAFTLELPPYRRPNVLRILYTSLVDRTIFVLLRAMATAAPAGAVIWLMANVHVGGATLAHHTAEFLGPMGWLMGLDGVILLAYIIAIPANEIVVPTIMMIYFTQNRMSESMLGDPAALYGTLVTDHGWSLMTVICFMLFVLLHNPCGTTILTIWKETHSRKWTLLAALGPVVMGVVVCMLVAGVWRMIG